MQRISRVLTIASAGTVSTAADISSGTGHIGIRVPTIDTAILYLTASEDKNGTFVRVQKPDGSADLSLASGTGGVYWVIDLFIPARFIKIVASAAQAGGARTFNCEIM